MDQHRRKYPFHLLKAKIDKIQILKIEAETFLLVYDPFPLPELTIICGFKQKVSRHQRSPEHQRLCFDPMHGASL